MTEHDAKIAARYRELAREEPPAAIDDAIRAAARRAVAPRRASFERRWAVPVSIAAVLVLAVGVTLRMQLEQPGVEVPRIESAAPSAAPADRVHAPAQEAPAAPATVTAEADAIVKKNVAPEPKAQAAPKAKVESQDLLRQKKQDERRRDENFTSQLAAAPAPAPEKKPEPVPFPSSPLAGAASTPAAAGASAPAAAAAPPPAMALRKEEASGFVAPQLGVKAREAEAKDSAGRLAADKPALDAAAPSRRASESNAVAPSAKVAAGAMREAPAAGERAATPEKELERIAELRRAGRNAEADEALARFRREHPGYRIADDVWERVRPR